MDLLHRRNFSTVDKSTPITCEDTETSMASTTIRKIDHQVTQTRSTRTTKVSCAVPESPRKYKNTTIQTQTWAEPQTTNNRTMSIKRASRAHSMLKEEFLRRARIRQTSRWSNSLCRYQGSTIIKTNNINKVKPAFSSWTTIAQTKTGRHTQAMAQETCEVITSSIKRRTTKTFTTLITRTSKAELQARMVAYSPDPTTPWSHQGRWPNLIKQILKRRATSINLEYLPLLELCWTSQITTQTKGITRIKQ